MRMDIEQLKPAGLPRDGISKLQIRNSDEISIFKPHLNNVTRVSRAVGRPQFLACNCTKGSTPASGVIPGALAGDFGMMQSQAIGFPSEWSPSRASREGWFWRGRQNLRPRRACSPFQFNFATWIPPRIWNLDFEFSPALAPSANHNFTF